MLEWAARPLAGVKATLRSMPYTSVARGLQRVAEEEEALAIVVGPSHRGEVEDVVPGSVGERLLHGAPCPVAVAPRGYWSDAFRGIHRIGVGFVPSASLDEALCAATGIALRTGAAIRALSVVDLPDSVTLGIRVGVQRPCADRPRRPQASLTRNLADVTSPVEITGEVVDGYADDELARLSEEVDLLVCGSRWGGPVGRVVLGSIAAGVLRKAHCPVLVVPRGARDGFATLRAPATAAA